MSVYMVMQRLRWLVAGLLPWWPGFTPGPVHVEFVLDKVALGQVYLQVLQFTINIISTWVHTLVSSGGLTIGPQEATVQTQSHPIDMKKQVFTC
jgi:hypothetical protein